MIPSLDLQKIADNLVVAFLGGWWTWVTFGILRAKRDLNGAHRNIRKLANVISSSSKNRISDPMATRNKEDVRNPRK